jgi:hypothetical protein
MSGKRATIAECKKEISFPKSELLRIWRKLDQYSPAQAEKLMKIIIRLEAFQK